MNSYRDNLARTLLPLPPRTSPVIGRRVPPETQATTEPRSLRLRDVVRDHITQVLARTDWVIEGPQGAAALLDMKPSTLRYRIRLLGIRKPPKRETEDHVTFIFPRKHIPLRT